MCIYQAACSHEYKHSHKQKNDTLGETSCQRFTRPREYLHDSFVFFFFLLTRYPYNNALVDNASISPRKERHDRKDLSPHTSDYPAMRPRFCLTVLMNIHDSAVAAIRKPQKNYHTPELETQRLVLRPLCLSDAQVIFDNWARDADVAYFMSWSQHQSIEETRAWLEAEKAALVEPTSFNFGYVLKATKELIGSGGLHYNEEHACFELGYCLMKSQWGFGLATEAARRILDFAIRELGISTFFGSHATDNPASGHVLTKLGFVYTDDGFFESSDGTKAFPNKNYHLTTSL